MKESEIKELVEQMEQGVQTAYERIYAETSKGVFFICMSFLHNEEDAKDVMQETYITAYNKVSQLKEKEKFVPWLNQIAVNKCKEKLRKSAPAFLDVEDLENAVREENENFLPEEYITNKEKRKIVMDIMRKTLSDIQYRTVILFYFNRLTVEEIADIMECPPGTVKYRLSVARAKIRDGVLEYEKETKDKLYSFAGIPLLVSLFAMEVEAMVVPNDVWKNIKATLDFAKDSMNAGENTSDKFKETEGMKEMAKKAGFWAGKGKVVAIIISIVVIIGTGVGIAIGIGKGKGNDGQTVVTQENSGVENNESSFGEGGEGTAGVLSEAEQSSVEVHEVFHLQQRWLTSHDFSSGQLKSAPADYVFFPDSEYPFLAPYAFDSVGELPNMETDLSTVLEASGEDGSSIEIRSNDGRYYDGYILWVYNLSLQELSAQECIDNGWVAFYSADPAKTDHFEMLLGYNEEEIQSSYADGIVRNTDYLEQVLKDFGSPTYIGIGMTLDSMGETIDEMNDRLDNPSDYENDLTITIDTSLMAYYESAMTTEGDETVYFAWEFEEYVLWIVILDGSTEWEEGVYSPAPVIMYSALYDREVWDALIENGNLNYSENRRDVFYPEGFVMPQKSN